MSRFDSFSKGFGLIDEEDKKKPLSFDDFDRQFNEPKPVEEPTPPLNDLTKLDDKIVKLPFDTMEEYNQSLNKLPPEVQMPQYNENRQVLVPSQETPLPKENIQNGLQELNQIPDTKTQPSIMPQIEPVSKMNSTEPVPLQERKISSPERPEDSQKQYAMDLEEGLKGTMQSINKAKNMFLTPVRDVIKKSREAKAKYGINENALMEGFFDSLVRMPEEDRYKAEGLLQKAGYMIGNVGENIGEFALISKAIPKISAVEKIPMVGNWVSNVLHNVGSIGAMTLVDELAEKDPDVNRLKEKFKGQTPYMLAFGIAPYVSGLRYATKPEDITFMKKMLGLGYKFSTGGSIAFAEALREGNSFKDSVIIGIQAGGMVTLTGEKMLPSGVFITKGQSSDEVIKLLGEARFNKNPTPPNKTIALEPIGEKLNPSPIRKMILPETKSTELLLEEAKQLQDGLARSLAEKDYGKARQFDKKLRKLADEYDELNQKPVIEEKTSKKPVDKQENDAKPFNDEEYWGKKISETVKDPRNITKEEWKELTPIYNKLIKDVDSDTYWTPALGVAKKIAETRGDIKYGAGEGKVKGEKRIKAPVTSKTEKLQKPQPKDTLAQEALKYDSAEEFVNGYNATFERGGEIRYSSGEAGDGIYAYESKSKSMRDYYTKNGEEIQLIEPKKDANIIDLTKEEAISEIIDIAEKQMVGGTKANKSNYHKQLWAIKQYLYDKPNDGYIIQHKGIGIPTGKQLIITNENKFEIKTKQQLIDIYNEAHSNKKKKQSSDTDNLSASNWGVDLSKEKLSDKKINKTQIMQNIEKMFGVPLKTKATTRMGRYTAGTYNRKTDIVRLKKWGELEPLTHEVAHFIDRKILEPSLGVNWKESNVIAKRELESLDYDQNKKRTSEGFAEYIRMYVTGLPVQKNNPAFTKQFNQIMKDNPDLSKKIDDIKTMYTTWKEQGAIERINQQIDFKGEHTKGNVSKFKKARDWLEKKWLDELNIIGDVTKQIEKKIGKELPPSKNPFKMATYYKLKSNAIAKTFIVDNSIDMYGNVKGKGLVEIIKPIGKKNMKDFIAYAVAKRARSLELRNKQTGFDLEDIMFTIKTFKNDIWDKVIDDIAEWNSTLIDWLVESGGLSKETSKLIKELNPIYIPFKRAFINDDSIVVTGGKKIADMGTAVKTLKGSTRPIINPIESLIAQTSEIISKAQRMNLAKIFADLAETEDGLGGFIVKVPPPMEVQKIAKSDIIKKLEDAGVLDQIEGDVLDTSQLDEFLTFFSTSQVYKGKENIVSIWKNGKRNFYEVNQELYDSMKGIDSDYKKIIGSKLLAPFARLQRLGATGLKLSFPLRNLIRDTFSYVVFSKNLTANPLDPLTGIYKDLTSKEGDLAQRFKAVGGKLSGMYGYDRASTMKVYDEYFKSDLEKLSEGKVLTILAKPLDFLREALSVGEVGVRISELEKSYERLRKENPDWTEEDLFVEAFNDAQDVTINFTKSGEYGKQMNQVQAFFNASVQGTNKLYRTIKERPVSFTIKGLIYLTIPALLLYMKNKDKQWYKNLPPAYKYSNLFFEVGDEIIRVPIPYGVGTLFMASPQAFFDYMETTSPEYLKGLLEVVGKDVPSIGVSALDPLVDIWKNKNFLGQPIVSKGMEYKYPTERYKDYTTDVSKAISKGLDTVSKGKISIAPIQLDYLMNNYTGGFFMQIPSGEETEFSRMPVIRDFLVGSKFNPKRQLNNFFYDYEKLSQRNNSNILTSKEKIEWNKIKPLAKKIVTSKTSYLKQLKQSYKNKDTKRRDYIYKNLTYYLKSKGYE